MPFQTCMTSTVEHKQRYPEEASLLSSIQRNSIGTGLSRSKIDKNYHKSTKSKSIIKVVDTIHELYSNSSEVIQLLPWAVFLRIWTHATTNDIYITDKNFQWFSIQSWFAQKISMRWTAKYQTSGSAHKNISKSLCRFNPLRPQYSFVKYFNGSFVLFSHIPFKCFWVGKIL